MKVALFTDTYYPQKNGVVTFLSDFLPVLSKYAEVVLFAPGDRELKIEKKGGIRVYSVPALPFPFYEGYRMATIRRKKIAELLAAEKPDVIHLHAPVLLGLRALLVGKKMHIPVVATYHTHFPDYLPHLSKGLLRGWIADMAKIPVQKLVGIVFSQADVVTAPTTALKRELEGYGIRNVNYIPNGISFSKFENVSTRQDIRKFYNIPNDAPLVLYVGRISFEKRIEVLLSAFRLVKKEVPNACLVIAGSGPYLADYKKLANAMRLKGVLFTGFVPDRVLPLLYKTADVFVSASDSETFGLTFVEAMYFGLPVVGVKRLGAASVIRAQTGLLTEPGDEVALATNVIRILKNRKLRKRLGMFGKKEAKRYEIENVVKRFLSIYKKLTRKSI
ncbi:MAG: glycosyltransferase [Candidatus Bilamarchaeaceae archaeon]